MATSNQNLSVYRDDTVPAGDSFRIGVIISEWNADITTRLFNACIQTLTRYGVKKDNLVIVHVPGSFEIPSAAQLLLESQEFDAVICLGCIIKGETKHDEYIGSAVSHGIMMLSLDYSTPVIFGVLTTDNFQQATDRAGGNHGNKGDEAAITALKMAALRRRLI